MVLRERWQDCVRLSTKLTVVSGLTVVLLFVSCKAPTKSVETIKSSQDYLTVKIDSVIYRDSIWLEKKNDTVYLTHNTYRDRWHKDTIQRTDTLRVEKDKMVVQKEIVRKTDWIKTLSIAIGLVVLLGLIRFIKRNKIL